jgi:hypothetical protein
MCYVDLRSMGVTGWSRPDPEEQIGEREGSAQSGLTPRPLLAPRYLGRYAIDCDPFPVSERCLNCQQLLRRRPCQTDPPNVLSTI